MTAAWGRLGRLFLTAAACLAACLAPLARDALAEGCTELIADGGFEAGGAWVLGATALPPQYVTHISHSGNRSLAFGITEGRNVNGYSSARQAVVVPAAPDRVTLSWWFYAAAEGQVGGDKMQAALLNADGATQYVLWTSWAGSGTWQRLTFDLSRWRGRALQVYFGVYNDGVGGTLTMYLDDVSLSACVSGTAPVTATPSASPSATQPSAVPAAECTPCGMVPPRTVLPPPAFRTTPWTAAVTRELESGAAPGFVAPSDVVASGTRDEQAPEAMPSPEPDGTPVAASGLSPSPPGPPAADTPVPLAPATAPLPSPGSAGTPADPLRPSAPGSSQGGVGASVWTGGSGSGFAPQLTRVALVVTPEPTPTLAPTRIPTIQPSGTRAVAGEAEGRLASWPRGWWWGVIGIFVLITGLLLGVKPRH